MVKLKDIAEELGVSVVTVSNALSGKKGVSDEVREEIFRTARKLGYDTSRYTEKRETETRIAVIVPRKYLEVGNSFYWAMYQQVAYAASKRNSFTILALSESTGEEKNMLPGIVSEKSVDGIIVVGRIEPGQMRKLQTVAKVPVVLVDFYEEGLPFDAVMSSNYLGMYKATRYLLERGHREIGFVGSVRETDNIMERYFGFRRGMEEWKLPIRKEWILEDRDLSTGKINIELPKRLPSAFVCNSDCTARYLYDRLIEKKYRVPEDVSIISYDNYLIGHPLANSLTTYNVDMPLMAKTAIDLLMKKKKRPDKKREIRYIDSEIIERESVKNLCVAFS